MQGRVKVEIRPGGMSSPYLDPSWQLLGSKKRAQKLLPGVSGSPGRNPRPGLLGPGLGKDWAQRVSLFWGEEGKTVLV